MKLLIPRLSFFDFRTLGWCFLIVTGLVIGFRTYSYYLAPRILLHSILSSTPQENTSPGALADSRLVRLYLDVVRDTVCGLTLRTLEGTIDSIGGKKRPIRVHERLAGFDTPIIGITMIGQRRLDNIEWALRHVISNQVLGDFIECGVWRGGGSVFARAVLGALGDTDRQVWVVDSFEGLPKARTKNDDNSWSEMKYLKVSLEEVQTNFLAFGLLDNRVHFCKGYFVHSLPLCNVSKIAVLRMDGDMYESTMDQLFNLYSKVQVGGIIIVDDYAIDVCRRAIHDFRTWHNITEKIVKIANDHTGVYWLKQKNVELQRYRYDLLLVTSQPKTK